MNRKEFEIISSVGSVLLLAILFIAVHQFMQASQEYGFVASIAAFIVVISIMGLKMVTIE